MDPLDWNKRTKRLPGLAREAHGTVSNRWSALGFARSCSSEEQLYSRMGLTHLLRHHKGCVNHVSFNSTGTLLLSGSDDTHLCWWDVDQPSLRGHMLTGHSLNIFCTKFLPGTGDSLAATCAGDGHVHVHDLTRRETLRTLAHHTEPAKKLVADEEHPHLLLSCSEDGTVAQVDLREPSRRPAVLLELVQGLVLLEVNSISTPRLRPWLLAVGAGDERLRVFDRRMLVVSGRSATHEYRRCRCVLRVNPGDHDPHFVGQSITGVCFSEDGSSVLANYSGDRVYEFNVSGALQQQLCPPNRQQSAFQPSNAALRHRMASAGSAGAAAAAAAGVGAPQTAAAGAATQRAGQLHGGNAAAAPGSSPDVSGGTPAGARHSNGGTCMHSQPPAGAVASPLWLGRGAPREQRSTHSSAGGAAAPADEAAAPAPGAAGEAHVAAVIGAEQGQGQGAALGGPPDRPAREGGDGVQVQGEARRGGGGGGAGPSSASASSGGSREHAGLDQMLHWLQTRQVAVPQRKRGAVAGALLGRSEALYEAGDVAEALRYCRQAAVLHPTNGAAHFQVARCLEALGDISGALEEATLALRFCWSLHLNAMEERLTRAVDAQPPQQHRDQGQGPGEGSLEAAAGQRQPARAHALRCPAAATAAGAAGRSFSGAAAGIFAGASAGRQQAQLELRQREPQQRHPSPHAPVVPPLQPHRDSSAAADASSGHGIVGAAVSGACHSGSSSSSVDEDAAVGSSKRRCLGPRAGGGSSRGGSLPGAGEGADARGADGRVAEEGVEEAEAEDEEVGQRGSGQQIERQKKTSSGTGSEQQGDGSGSSSDGGRAGCRRRRRRRGRGSDDGDGRGPPSSSEEGGSGSEEEDGVGASRTSSGSSAASREGGDEERRAGSGGGESSGEDGREGGSEQGGSGQGEEEEEEERGADESLSEWTDSLDELSSEEEDDEEDGAGRSMQYDWGKWGVASGEGVGCRAGRSRGGGGVRADAAGSESGRSNSSGSNDEPGNDDDEEGVFIGLGCALMRISHRPFPHDPCTAHQEGAARGRRSAARAGAHADSGDEDNSNDNSDSGDDEGGDGSRRAGAHARGAGRTPAAAGRARTAAPAAAGAGGALRRWRSYAGHCSVRTVKDVAYVGPGEGLVAAGSDDGRFFLWDRATGCVVAMPRADRHVVNCIASHPTQPLLATCGIDYTVKLFRPCRPACFSSKEETWRLAQAAALNEMMRYSRTEAAVAAPSDADRGGSVLLRTDVPGGATQQAFGATRARLLLERARLRSSM